MKARIASPKLAEARKDFCFCSTTPKYIAIRGNIDISALIQEIHLAKPNYRHAKKQKEAARKARQDAKQVRRSTVPDVPVEPPPAKPVA
jgi:hypothetical protein